MSERYEPEKWADAVPSLDEAIACAKRWAEIEQANSRPTQTREFAPYYAGQARVLRVLIREIEWERTPLKLCEAELVIMRRALEATGGNRTKAAELLGINVRTLRRKLNGGAR